MTEEEWLTTTDPGRMLYYADNFTSQRKRTLFCVACCRMAWQLLPEPLQAAVEAGEGGADRRGSPRLPQSEYWMSFAYSAALAVEESVWPGIDLETFVIGDPTQDTYLADEACTLRTKLTSLIRDLFGNPFRGPSKYQGSLTGWKPRWFVGVERAVLGVARRSATRKSSWLTAVVKSLAQAVYDERHLPSGLFDNQRMAILADALEEAGCDNADILDHLRGGGDHVRGCWAVDLILAKE